MKKNLKILIILLTIFIGFASADVKARTIEEKEQFTKQASGKHSISGLSIFDGTTFGMWKYSFVDTSSENFVGYCMDPHKDASNGYKVDRILGDTAYTKRINAFDLGVLEIIKNGKNQYNDSLTFTVDGSSKTISGDSLYAATSIAVRAFALGVFGYGGDVESAKSSLVSYYTGVASAHITSGIQWASYNIDKINTITDTKCTGSVEDFRKCYEKTFIKGFLKNNWYKNSYNFKVSSSSSEGYLVMYAAQSLFMKGFNRAYEVMTGDVTTATVTATANPSTTDKTTTDNTIEEYYHQTIEFAQFDAQDGKIDNFTLTCQDCAKNNITLGNLEFFNPQINDWQVVSNINVLTAFDADGKTKSGKIELRFKVTRIKDDENCKSVNYKISYRYDDPSLKYIGALLKTSDTSKQRFFIIQKNDGNLKSEITGTIKCSASCDTELELPVCSYEEDDAVAKINGPTKIKTCIINNQDDAGNTYQFTSDVGGVDNSYCKIYCKEDYAEIKLNPIVKNVKCGGYFKLTSKINGTKTCYTGSPNTTENSTNGKNSIDKEKYLQDIKTVQENLVDAMNRYYEYKAKSEHSYDSNSTTKSCGGSSCGSREKITVTWEAYDKVTFTWNHNTESGTYNYGTQNGGTKSWSDSCWCNTCGTPKSEGGSGTYSCCGGCDSSASTNYKSWSNDVKSELQRAKSDLTKYMAQYKQIIQDYNACTTTWTNEFAFAQKVKYYYDENRGKDNENYAPYFDLLADKKELQYLEKYGNEKVDTKITVCTGATNDKYECLDKNKEKTFDLSIDKNSLQDYNYNSSYGTDVFNPRNYVICSIASGCITDTRQISQAAFVKKEVTKEQKYITPTAFYQIAANGKVIAYDNYSIDKVQLEPLVNKLPISTSSVGGGVFKLLVENLGEFYDKKDTYGRLIDYNGVNETKSVAYAVGVNAFDGEYVCYYENTCRPKDCPNCDFVCEGDGCEWKDCPSCNISCVNCIFNLDDLNIIVKTITTTDVNAANRTHGYNWITSSSMEALQLLTKKASMTISEIEEINEMIYDDKTTDGSTLGFSIKLTPEIINKITAYNKDNEDNGGYINNSLTCYDATIDGETYKNIYCYSELIDKLVTENGDNVTVLPSRVNDETRRANDTGTSGYWTLWSNYRIDKTSESVIGGPSWK